MLDFKYTQTSVGNSQTFMTKDNFIEILRDMKLINQITEEQIHINFNLSIGNNPEEMKCNENHLKIKSDKKHELYECWARTVEQLKFPMQMEESDKAALKLNFEQPTGNYED